MRRIIPLVVALISLLGIGIAVGTPANALGTETLGCKVAPDATTYTSTCINDYSYNGGYAISFLVSGVSGPETYSWSISGTGTASAACSSSTSDECGFTVSSRHDQDVVATVVITQNGASETLTTDATIMAVCGDEWC
jgi:hypothetical protein